MPARTSTARVRSPSSTGRTSSRTSTTCEPPLRMIGFKTNNYFGQQFKTDWNGFRLLEHAQAQVHRPVERRRRLPERRTKEFPALGSEMGWYGTDLIRDLEDPYREDSHPLGQFHQELLRLLRHLGPEGLRASTSWARARRSSPTGRPARARPGFSAQHDPPFQEDRGRLNIRHMQRFLPDDDDHQFEELAAPARSRPTPPTATSSRNTTSGSSTPGMDQETLAYVIWQKDNQYANLWTEANLQNWYTDTQWLPRGRLLPPGRLVVRQSFHVLHTFAVQTTRRFTPTSW